jgi:hypothetical protein
MGNQGVTRRCRLADQYIAASYMSPNAGGWCCGVSANEHGCAHGAQINFGDLTPYLTYALHRQSYKSIIVLWNNAAYFLRMMARLVWFGLMPKEGALVPPGGHWLVLLRPPAGGGATPTVPHAPTTPPPKIANQSFFQCSGSMTFWCGSGSADPCLWQMDPDPDPGYGYCYFRHWSSRCQQKTFLTQFFLLVTFWRYTYIIFQR